MEKGLFRKDEEQIAQDTSNQENARQRLEDLLCINVATMVPITNTTKIPAVIQCLPKYK
jgi:hypothetical protein